MPNRTIRSVEWSVSNRNCRSLSRISFSASDCSYSSAATVNAASVKIAQNSCSSKVRSDKCGRVAAIGPVPRIVQTNATPLTVSVAAAAPANRYSSAANTPHGMSRNSMGYLSHAKISPVNSAVSTITMTIAGDSSPISSDSARRVAFSAGSSTIIPIAPAANQPTNASRGTASAKIKRAMPNIAVPARAPAIEMPTTVK